MTGYWKRDNQQLTEQFEIAPLEAAFERFFRNQFIVGLDREKFKAAWKSSDGATWVTQGFIMWNINITMGYQNLQMIH